MNAVQICVCQSKKDLSDGTVFELTWRVDLVWLSSMLVNYQYSRQSAVEILWQNVLLMVKACLRKPFPKMETLAKDEEEINHLRDCEKLQSSAHKSDLIIIFASEPASFQCFILLSEILGASVFFLRFMSWQWMFLSSYMHANKHMHSGLFFKTRDFGKKTCRWWNEEYLNDAFPHWAGLCYCSCYQTWCPSGNGIWKEWTFQFEKCRDCRQRRRRHIRGSFSMQRTQIIKVCLFRLLHTNLSLLSDGLQITYMFSNR